MTTQAAALVTRGQPGKETGVAGSKAQRSSHSAPCGAAARSPSGYVKTQILAFGWEGWTLDPTKAEPRPLPL